MVRGWVVITVRCRTSHAADHWVCFIWYLFNSNFFAVLLLNGYECDFGSGLTELKATDRRWRRYALY